MYIYIFVIFSGNTRMTPHNVTFDLFYVTGGVLQGHYPVVRLYALLSVFVCESKHQNQQLYSQMNKCVTIVKIPLCV